MSEYHLSIKEIGILTNGKWPQWSRKVQVALQANGTWIYIEGAASTKPTTATELKDWHTTNDCIAGALCGIIDDALLQDLEKLGTAKEVWTHLKKKTHQGGIVAKLTALQAAIQARFTSHTSIIMTITGD